MTEQVPSKEKLPDWLRRWYALKGELRFREAADEIERLQLEKDQALYALDQATKRAENEPLQESGKGADEASRDRAAPTPRGSLPNSLGNEHLYQPDQEWMSAPLGASQPSECEQIECDGCYGTGGGIEVDCIKCDGHGYVIRPAPPPSSAVLSEPPSSLAEILEWIYSMSDDKPVRNMARVAMDKWSAIQARTAQPPRARDADLYEWVSGLIETLNLAGITRAKGDEHIDTDYLAELHSRLAQPPPAGLPNALRRELIFYVRHHATCATCHDSMVKAKPQCNCGLDALLDRLGQPPSAASMSALMDPTELSCLAIQIRTSHENWSRREFERIARALDRAANRIWELEREANKQGDLLENVNVHTNSAQQTDCGSTDRGSAESAKAQDHGDPVADRAPQGGVAHVES